MCIEGADVIVDDVYDRDEPLFQDGIIAQAINQVVANGCFYFSMAGNSGNLNDSTSGTWEGDFVAGGELVVDGIEAGWVVHDFGGGVTANTINHELTGYVALQWADPRGASANDYDLFLLDAAGERVVASATNVQDSTGYPHPIERITHLAVPQPFDRDMRLAITKAPDAAERYLHLGILDRGLEIATDGAIYGHNAAENAITVAAVDVGEAGGAGGVFDGTESVETFSADGPRRVFFEPDGTPITPGDYSSSGGKVRQKPDLAAANCVSTSAPGFGHFCGTSAAAPHAAAIAALCWRRRADPAHSPCPSSAPRWRRALSTSRPRASTATRAPAS